MVNKENRILSINDNDEDYKPIIVDISQVPMRRKNKWRERLLSLQDGKAIRLEYETREKLFQVRNVLTSVASQNKIPISTRHVHESPPTHKKDCYVLYFWKKENLING